MNKLQLYIGCKIIRAIPMTLGRFVAETARWHLMEDTNFHEDTRGYKVIYPDGYVSWSPKDTFEAAYRPVTEDELRLLS